MSRIIFNGQTGGLGRFFGNALEKRGLAYSSLKSRLGEPDRIAGEFDSLPVAPGEKITLVPLAGLVPVVTCEKEPDRAFKTNVTDTVALVQQFLAWAKRNNASARVLYVSTGHVYAPKPAGERLAETDPVAPRSVYARTKLQAEDALRSLFRDRSSDLIIARVFGLLSPAQPPPYVLPSLIRRAAERNFSNMAGLDCVRDYLDARDVTRALAALCATRWDRLALPPNRVVNVGSGEGTPIRDLFAMVVDVSGLRWPDVEGRVTRVPPRPDDIACMIADPSLLKRFLGATPRSIPLLETVRDAVRASQSSSNSAIVQ